MTRLYMFLSIVVYFIFQVTYQLLRHSRFDFQVSYVKALESNFIIFFFPLKPQETHDCIVITKINLILNIF